NITIHKLMPRFIHVKPKAKPEEIDSFAKKVFPYNYYANITMGLKATPNSTDVWWEMFEEPDDQPPQQFNAS
ncbi:unnamed protein product, partial [Didymodactylos carnosus]